MNLGLFIIPIRYKNTDSYPFDYLDFCVEAEKSGFSEVYIGEHITDAKEDIRSSMIFASALASRTKKIKICLSVLPLPHYNVDLLFSQLKDLYLLTEGRLKVGIGPGALNSDLNYMKIDVQRRYIKFEENLEMFLNIRHSLFSTILSPYPVNSRKLNDIGIGIFSSNFSSRNNLNAHITCYSSNKNLEECLSRWSIGHNFISETISQNSKNVILSSFKYIHEKLGDKAYAVMGIKDKLSFHNSEIEDYKSLFQNENHNFKEYLDSLPLEVNTNNHVLNVFDCLDDNEYVNSLLEIGEQFKSII